MRQRLGLRGAFRRLLQPLEGRLLEMVEWPSVPFHNRRLHLHQSMPLMPAGLTRGFSSLFVDWHYSPSSIIIRVVCDHAALYH